MELLCLEKAAQPLFAVDDPVFTDDERVLQNLCFLEKQYLPKFAYFKCVQTEITPEMRKIIAEWLLEVCEAERIDDGVFPSAMNILDRFLCLVNIRKYQLQLLSCVCLLLACKLRLNEEYITIDKLVNYTDYSVTADEISAWELFVLNTLQWDILAVTPNDFLELIMPRLEARYKHKQNLIRKHAQVFISLCIIDYKFAFYRPSLIAMASVKTALDGLFNRSRPVLEQIQNKCQSVDMKFLSIERVIFWKQNYKSKMHKISLMIEESCFRANKSNNTVVVQSVNKNQNANNQNTNNQNTNNQNTNNQNTNNQNNSNLVKSTNNHQTNQKIITVTNNQKATKIMKSTSVVMTGTSTFSDKKTVISDQSENVNESF